VTEDEWANATCPYTMLKSLKGKLSERKLLLFTAYCVVRHRLLPHDEHGERISQAGALFLDGSMSGEQFHDSIATSYGPEYPPKLSSSRAFNAHEQSRYLSEMFRFHASHDRYTSEDPHGLDCYLIRDRERQRHSVVLRELTGNPFRPFTVDPLWQTESVVALASGIYADRAFDRMPILADALEEAGCDDREVLNHCRGAVPHVRGCWVVDLVLGKD
jgi:hypothetical protein